MFGCYRKGDANDPDTYVAAIAAILADYENEVIRQVTDPRYGLPRRLSFMPTAKEVADACEAEQASADRIKKYRDLKPALRIEGPRRHRANVLVHTDAPKYAAMVARSATANPMEWRMDDDGRGIWVALGWLESTWSAVVKPLTMTEEQLRKHYPPREPASASRETSREGVNG